MRVAAVQAAPVFLDRSATVDKVVALLEDAASTGAELVAFPEGFVPGHPGWVEFQPVDERALVLSKALFLNAVEIPGPDLEPVLAACRELRVAAVLGVCERLPRSTGTLFNTQVFVNREGQVAAKHQKIVPTVGERMVHGPGTTGSANSFDAGGVTVTGLICGENSNPLAQYASVRAYPSVHVASWPSHFNPMVPMQSVVEMVSKSLAYTLRCFVLNSVATISVEMIDAYGSDASRDWLASPEAGGRSSIITPAGTTCAEADGATEQLVSADVDPDDVIIPKFVHDFAGHYNRPELFAHLFTRDEPA